MNKRLLWLVITIPLLIMIIVILWINYKKTTNLRKSQAPSIAQTVLFNSLKELESKSDLQGIKTIYQKLLVEYPSSPQVSQWEKMIEEVNMKLLFSPVITKGSLLYEIKPGDTLSKIAREHHTTVELLMKANNLSSDKIRPGRRIKVYTQPFSIVVDRSQNTLILKSSEEVIKTYIISTGISTPIGTFKVTNKLENPPWFKDGVEIPANSPDNILGSHWLGINVPGYGIHGTTDPQSLGKQVTQGCVRMANRDVEELYTVLPLGAEVNIVE